MAEIRPPEVAAWMRARRKWVDVEIRDLAAFETSWWAWWKALQPPERADAKCSTMPRPRDTMDWEGLQKAGANGLLLLVVALRWWGKASGADAGWQVAANDFYLALCCITRTAIDADVGNASVDPGPERQGKGVSTRHSTIQASAKAIAAMAQPTKKRGAAAPTGEESAGKKGRLTGRR